MNTNLENAYNPEKFRELGHQLIDMLADHLTAAIGGTEKVMNWKEPAEQLEYWDKNSGLDQPLPELFKNIIENSIHIHHPRYIGHQVGPTLPAAALADLLGAMLNNGMAIYEMGAAASAIENVVVKIMLRQIGYGNEADGFLTSGGTLANLTALLAARKTMADKDV